MPESLLVAETTVRDNLIAGSHPIITKSVTLASGTNYAKGTLLGKITKSTPTTGTAGTNTGNGTMTAVTAGSKTKLGTYSLRCYSKGVASVTMPTSGTAGTNTGAGTCTAVTAGTSAIPGTYTIRCIETSSGAGKFEVLNPYGERLSDATVGVAYTSEQINFTLNDGTPDFALGDTFTVLATSVNGGIFSVKDPDGNSMPDATVGAAYANNQLNFIINDGSTDFAVGDTFTVVVAAGSGYYKTALSASVDGSQDIADMAVLAEATDATSAIKTAIIYITGEFNTNVMTFGTGFSASAVKDDLAKRSIYLKTTIAAA